MLIDKDKIPPITKEHIFSILGDDDINDSSDNDSTDSKNFDIDDNIIDSEYCENGAVNI